MKRDGFTMLEVMFAIMILGVGLIAVLSIFPMAGSVQRATFDDVRGQQVASSAVALASTTGATKDNPLPLADRVFPMGDLRTKQVEFDGQTKTLVENDYVWELYEQEKQVGNGETRGYSYIIVFRLQNNVFLEDVEAGLLNDAGSYDQLGIDVLTDDGVETVRGGTVNGVGGREFIHKGRVRGRAVSVKIYPFNGDR